MNKYIIRASLALSGVATNTIAIVYNWPDTITTVLCACIVGFCIAEFSFCLICYHHALWTIQDQTEQKSPDGTK